MEKKKTLKLVASNLGRPNISTIFNLERLDIIEMSKGKCIDHQFSP